MTEEDKKPWTPPVPTTYLAACLDDVITAMRLGVLTFPAIAVPFGADETMECRFFGSAYEISEKDFENLLTDSYPMRDGIQRVHIISWHMLEHSTPLPSAFEFLELSARLPQ